MNSDLPILFLMLGYPGAGKTTTSRVIHKLSGAEHIWADQERRSQFGEPNYTREENAALYERLNVQADELLRAGKSVIFDTNFNFRKDRQRLRKLAEAAGARCFLVWVQTDKQLAKKRATEDASKQDSRVLGNMPPAQFERMSRNLEEPHADEAYISVDGTRVSEGYIADVLAAHGIIFRRSPS